MFLCWKLNCSQNKFKILLTSGCCKNNPSLDPCTHTFPMSPFPYFMHAQTYHQSVEFFLKHLLKDYTWMKFNTNIYTVNIHITNNFSIDSLLMTVERGL